MKHIKFILLLVFLNNVNLFSQENLLFFSPGAKSIAMGRTGVIQIDDPTALYWNPALLGDIKRRSAIVAVNEPHHLTYTGYSQFFPLTGTFAASVSHTQKDISGTELYSVGWGKQISRYLYTGAAVNNAVTPSENWVTMGVGLYIKADSNPNSIYRTLPMLSVLNSPFFRDRFTMGFSMQNIPITESGHDHQTRIGASYKLTRDGFTILFGYHMQSIENTSHLSLILPLQKNLKFIAGTMDYQFNKTAFGTEINMAGFDLQLVYDYNVKRILFSTSVHIGQPLNALAHDEHERAKSAVELQLPDIALEHTKRSLEYDPANQEANKFYTILNPLVEQNKIKAHRTLQTALQLEQNEWYISAAMHYMEVLKLDPENQTAESALERIRPRVNVHTERRFKLGKATLEKSELLKAKEIFESILYVRPDHQDSKKLLQKTNTLLFHEAENYFYTGLGFYSQRNLDQAEEKFKQALQFYPAYSEAREYIERIERDRQNNQKRVNELLQDARVQEAQNAWTNARENYQTILELSPGHSMATERLRIVNQKIAAIVRQNLTRGKSLFDNGELATAQRIFRQILRLDPGNSTAKEYLRQINSNTSSDANAFLVRAGNYVEAENWTMALSVTDSVLSKYPKSEEALELKSQIIAHMNVDQMLSNATSEYRNNNYMASMEISNQILVKDPGNIQALKLVEQSQKRLNDMVDNYFNKGLEMYTKENYRTAILMWEKALEINPYHNGSLEYVKRARERLRAIEQLQN